MCCPVGRTTRHVHACSRTHTQLQMTCFGGCYKIYFQTAFTILKVAKLYLNIKLVRAESLWEIATNTCVL